MTEIWKVIKGFPDYEVSNTGLVRHRKDLDGFGTYKYRLLKQNDKDNKHSLVTLSRCGVKSTVYVYKQVATSFIENPDDFRFVRHKDGNIKDNNVDNLVWYDKHKEKIMKASEKSLSNVLSKFS